MEPAHHYQTDHFIGSSTHSRENRRKQKKEDRSFTCNSHDKQLRCNTDLNTGTHVNTNITIPKSDVSKNTGKLLPSQIQLYTTAFEAPPTKMLRVRTKFIYHGRSGLELWVQVF